MYCQRCQRNHQALSSVEIPLLFWPSSSVPLFLYDLISYSFSLQNFEINKSNLFCFAYLIYFLTLYYCYFLLLLLCYSPFYCLLFNYVFNKVINIFRYFFVIEKVLVNIPINLTVLLIFQN
jgi:hypothetical protein